MNWEIIGALGEWAGALVVLVTLGYLARQIRENTVLNRVSGSMAIADAARDIHFLLAGNRDMARLFLEGLGDPDSLDAIDSARFETLWWGILRQMESFFVQFEEGIMDEGTMKAYARLSADVIHDNRIVRDHWRSSPEDFRPGFVAWMNEFSAARAAARAETPS